MNPVLKGGWYDWHMVCYRGKTRKIRSEETGARQEYKTLLPETFVYASLVKLPVFLEHKHSSVHDKAEGILSP